MTIIITEQDIINTYDKRQQEQCRLYYEYQRIKKENPTYGYKRIAKLLGHPYGKTRWWHAKKHIPVPIQTLIWLKEKNLIPLYIDHPQLPLIAKILGVTFGDGGIFQNLNAIFLSSSEIGAVKEFGEDLKIIFGKGKIKLNKINILVKKSIQLPKFSKKPISDFINKIIAKQIIIATPNVLLLPKKISNNPITKSIPPKNLTIIWFFKLLKYF